MSFSDEIRKKLANDENQRIHGNQEVIAFWKKLLDVNQSLDNDLRLKEEEKNVFKIDYHTGISFHDIGDVHHITIQSQGYHYILYNDILETLMMTSFNHKGELPVNNSAHDARVIIKNILCHHEPFIGLKHL